MGGTRLVQNDQTQICHSPSQQRRRAIFGRLKTVTALVLGVVTWTSGTNINNLGGNIVMASPPPRHADPMVAKAIEAVDALKQFLLTGNTTKKDDFLRIFNSESSGAFLTAFGAELRTKILGDSKLGPILLAFKSVNAGSTDLVKFVDVIAKAYDAVGTSDIGKIREIGTEHGETMVSLVVVPFLKAVGKEDFLRLMIPERLESSTVQTNASLFVSLIRTREKETRETIVTDLWKRIKTDLDTNGGVFPSGYMEGFFKVVKEQSPEIAAILSGYAKDKKTTPDKLTPEQLKELFDDHLLQIMNQLWVGQADRNLLAKVHGGGLTAAVNSYIVSVSTITKVITAAELLERIGEVEAFLKEKGVVLPTEQPPAGRSPTTEEQLAGLIKSWKDELGKTPLPDQKRLEVLNYQIPNRAEVEEIEKVTTLRATRITNMIEGKGSFYEVLGQKIFVPRLQGYLAQIDSYVLDGRIGSFASVFMRTHNVDRNKMQQLLETVRQANTAVPAAIETLDADLLQLAALDSAGTAGGDVQRTQRLTQFGALLSGQVDALTDAIAAFNGVVRGSPEWTGIRKSVAIRFMRQFVVVETDDPVAELVKIYERLTQDREFLNFRATFQDTLGVHLSDLSMATAATEGEQYMAGSRIATAQLAIQKFPTMPLQTSYALFRALTGKYKDLSAQYRNADEMSRVCSLIVGYGNLPPAYAALLFQKTTAPLLETYDDGSILAITKAIAGYSQIYISGDHYRMLQEYYNALPERIAKLFSDITAMQYDRREPTKDVRVRMPPEAEYGEVMLPGAHITIHIPKRIYATWAQKYGLTVSAAPRIVDNPAASADLFQVMSRYFEESMVNARTNIPFPWTRLPMLMNNLGVLAPDRFPPVGELIAARMGGDVTYHMTKVEDTGPAGTTTTRSDQGDMGVLGEFTREGQVTTASARYKITAQTTTGPDGVESGERTHVGTVRLQQARIHTDALGEYNINSFSGDITVPQEPKVVAQGETSTELDSRIAAVGTFWSGMAPAGADTLVYFKRLQAKDTVGQDGKVVPGEVSLVAHIFQRLPNGSFGEVDTVTLPKATAETLYWDTMKKPMQRLYGAARVQKGDVLTQMDGAFLFAGPFTGEPESEWDRFQGAGGAVQIGQWGGYGDWEQTRGRRGAAAFGRFMQEERALWLGRFSMDMFKYGDKTAGNKYYAEGQYIKVQKAEVKVFVGFSDREKDMAEKDLQGVAIVKYALGESFLGYRDLGIGGGRLIRRSGAPARQFTDDLSGGRLYGIQKDLLGGVVLSGLYRKFSIQQQAPATTPMGDMGVPSTTPELDDASSSQHPELGTQTTNVPAGEQKLIAAGFRRLLAVQHGLEVGALWDFTPNEGGGFVQWNWTPMGKTFTGMRLTAAVVYKKIGGAPLDSGGEHITLPIIGAATDWIASDKVRLKVEGYIPGVGEVKIFAPPVDTVFGGGYLSRIAGGGHLGFRIPLTLDRRLVLGVLGSASRDYYSDPTTQISPIGEISESGAGTTQGEGAVGLFYTFPTTGRGMQLGNIAGWVTGMYQTDAEQPGKAYQLDFRLATMFTDASTVVRGSAGVRQWQKWWPSIKEMRTGAGTSWVVTKRGLVRGWIDPFFRFNLNLDRVLKETIPSSKSEQLDITGSFELGATW